MRATSLLLALLLPFAAGCSGVKTYELALHGAADLNPNEEGQPSAVRVKVLRLEGEAAAQAFEQAEFDQVWGEPMTAEGVVTDVPPQTQYVQPRDERVAVVLDKVPPEVTHVGVLGLFNNPVVGKDRLVIGRDDFGELEVWLHGNVMERQPPPPPEARPGS